jgi:hypothetical protein
MSWPRCRRGVEDPGIARSEVAIGRLPPGARHALVLSGVYDCPRETADMLGTPSDRKRNCTVLPTAAARLYREEASAWCPTRIAAVPDQDPRELPRHRADMGPVAANRASARGPAGARRWQAAAPAYS